MKSKLSQLKDLITLMIVTSIFSPRSFAQMQTFYGVETEPVNPLYGVPPAFPDPSEDLLGFAFAIARMFALPLLILVILGTGVFFLIKKLRKRSKNKKSESPQENS